MATDLSGATSSDAGQVPAAEPAVSIDSAAPSPAASERRRRLSIRKPSVPKKHRGRFVFVYAALAAAVAAGAVGIVLLTTGGDSGKSGSSATAEGSWSTWKPNGGGLGAAQEIANHVAQGYKNAAGKQLLTVLAQTPRFVALVPDDKGNTVPAVVPLGGIIVHRKAGDTAMGISAQNSTMFNLQCAGDASCKSASAEARLSQTLLFRREVLELALYTFKYVPSYDNLLVLLQPDGTKVPEVLYFQRSDLASRLDQPLATTLGSKLPKDGQLQGKVRVTVARTVSPHVFKFPQVERVFPDLWVLQLRPAA